MTNKPLCFKNGPDGNRWICLHKRTFMREKYNGVLCLVWVQPGVPMGVGKTPSEATKMFYAQLRRYNAVKGLQ